MDRLWKINCSLLHKLQATGYNVSSEEIASSKTLLAFEVAFQSKEKLERIFYPRAGTLAAERNPKGVLLFFSEPEDGKSQIGVSEVRRLITKMTTFEVQLALFSTKGVLTSAAKKDLKKIQAPDLARVVVLEDREIMFSVVKHKRVPRHELLTPVEAKKWLEVTKLKRSQMPRIFTDDPQIKYLDGLPGDLVKVMGRSLTVGKLARHLVVVRRLDK